MNDYNLKYHYLSDFDRDMVSLCKKRRVFTKSPDCLQIDGDKQVLVFKRGGLTFLFNFSPVNSYEGYFIKVKQKGIYKVALSTDDYCYGGYGRVAHAVEYEAKRQENGEYVLPIYLPSRTAICLVKKSKSK